MGLEKRAPGCHEYVEDESANSSGTICSKFDGLDYFRFASSGSFFIYNDKTGNFERYWDSD